MDIANGGVASRARPHINQLAGESLLFNNAFSVTSVYQLFHRSILSGRMPTLLKEVGYMTDSIHKEKRMKPETLLTWDHVNETPGATESDRRVRRDLKAMTGKVGRFIQEADRKEKPFFLLVSSADPHRPFSRDGVPLVNWHWLYGPSAF